MKQERLFTAIGGADALLVLRSRQAGQRRRRTRQLRWSLAAAAACLALAVAGMFFSQPPATPAPPPEESAAPQPLRLDGGDTGTLHLLALSYGGPEAQATPDFILYVNREIYRSCEEDGRYVVEPLSQAQGLPPCRLEIAHLEDTSPAQAAAEAEKLLEASYEHVTPAEAGQTEGLRLHGSDGDAWDARQADVYLVDDLLGGVFRLTAEYFTEAAEGHGVRFADMVGTFQVVPPAGADGAPEWLRQLQDAARRLAPALLSHRLDSVEDLLAPGAQMDAYGEDVSADLSVAAIDCTVDDDQTPSGAVVSVRHRLGTEDSFSYLTIELSYEEGRWLARWSGIEK